MGKIKSKTLTKYKQLKVAHRGLQVGMFAAPLVPTVVIAGVNWSEWFAECGTSLPTGLSTLLVTTVLAILGVVRSDTVIKKKDLALPFLAILFLGLGVTMLFLSNIFRDLAWMFVYSAFGLGGTTGEYFADKLAVQPKIKEYKELVEKNALDGRTKKRLERKQRAKEEAIRIAEEEAKMMAEQEKKKGLI